MIDHENVKVNTALGISEEEYNSLVELVREELFSNKKISNLIVNSLIRIKEGEFNIDNVEESSISNYELKLILAGVYIERATSNATSIQQFLEHRFDDE
jgi:hypothetical protein